MFYNNLLISRHLYTIYSNFEEVAFCIVSCEATCNVVAVWSSLQWRDQTSIKQKIVGQLFGPQFDFVSAMHILEKYD